MRNRRDSSFALVCEANAERQPSPPALSQLDRLSCARRAGNGLRAVKEAVQELYDVEDVTSTASSGFFLTVDDFVELGASSSSLSSIREGAHSPRHSTSSWVDVPSDVESFCEL